MSLLCACVCGLSERMTIYTVLLRSVTRLLNEYWRGIVSVLCPSMFGMKCWLTECYPGQHTLTLIKQRSVKGYSRCRTSTKRAWSRWTTRDDCYSVARIRNDSLTKPWNYIYRSMHQTAFREWSLERPGMRAQHSALVCSERRDGQQCYPGRYQNAFNEWLLLNQACSESTR